MKYPKWSGIYRFNNPHFRKMMAQIDFRTLLGRRIAQAFRDCVCDKPELPIPLSALQNNSILYFRSTGSCEDSDVNRWHVREHLPYLAPIAVDIPRVMFTIPPNVDETLEPLPLSIDPSHEIGDVVKWGGTTWVVVGNDPKRDGTFVLMPREFVNPRL